MSLEVDFDYLEIKNAVWDCGSSKAPGPDDWSALELNRILLILEIFYKVFGLRLNVAKSHVFGIGVAKSEVISIANVAWARVGTFPTTYLGMPVGSNMKYISNWDVLINKFQSKLSLWKASLISSGGKLTLVKSVMGSLGIYLMSLFKYPEMVLKYLKSIRARFFWGVSNSAKKMSWIKWDKVLASLIEADLMLEVLRLSILHYLLNGGGGI
ncbi:uncharacterized protein [Rutidosis leptorrhynchoides]|uniref:uncharacterized protein n=1 Tax=Rutidosis leptorrhynchoides TaxID=125765 RepID=UPI003A9A43BA